MRVGRRTARQPHTEHRPAFVAQADLAAVLGDQSFDQCQAKSARSGMAGLFGGEARFEDTAHQLAGNPRPGVAHLRPDRAVALAQVDDDGAARLAFDRIERVLNQIAHGALEKLVDDLALVVQGADDYARSIGPGLSEESRARVTNQLDELKDSCRRLKERAIVGARATDRHLRRHPYSFVAAAAVLGLVIGLKWSGRADRGD